MRSPKIIIALLICAALLGACGLKGPLFLPGEDGQAKSTTEEVLVDDDLTVTKKKDKGSGAG